MNRRLRPPLRRASSAAALLGILVLGLGALAQEPETMVGAPQVVASSSGQGASLGIPRWKGYMDPQQPDRFWLSFSNGAANASNIVFTTDGGDTWRNPGLNPGVNGFLDYHLSLFGDGGDLYFTFPSDAGIQVRRFRALVDDNSDRGPLITMPNTTPYHRSSIMVDGNHRVWVFTRCSDNAGENVRYAWSDDAGATWTHGVAVASGAANVRIGSMPFLDGRACLVVLHLGDPRGYEYYLWDGTCFVARPDHTIWAEDLGYDRAFSLNAVGDNLHLIFGRGSELHHVWKRYDGGNGAWHDNLLLDSPSTIGLDMLPIATVRGDRLYLFYCLRSDGSPGSSRICMQVWDQGSASWGPQTAISDASTAYNVHPNTCFHVPATSSYVPVFWTAGADGSQLVFNKVIVAPPGAATRASLGGVKSLYR